MKQLSSSSTLISLSPLCQKCHREEIKTTKRLLEFLPRKLSLTSLMAQIPFKKKKKKNPLPRENKSEKNHVSAFSKSPFYMDSPTGPTHGLFLQTPGNLYTGWSKDLTRR